MWQVALLRPTVPYSVIGEHVCVVSLGAQESPGAQAFVNRDSAFTLQQASQHRAVVNNTGPDSLCGLKRFVVVGWLKGRRLASARRTWVRPAPGADSAVSRVCGGAEAPSL